MDVGTPYEAYPGKGNYIAEFDLDRQEVFDHLLSLVLAGVYIYIHFGLVRSSFSLLQTLFNGGTRTADRPQGDGSLDREVHGNNQATAVAKLCWAQHRANGWFSIENPRGSFVWNFGPILELASICIDVDFDMCEYGLLPPHLTESDSVFIKKPTRLRTNLNALSALSCKCSGTHKHFACMGHVRVGGKSVRVSTAAGVYPRRLCRRWAKLVAAAVAPA